MNNREFVLTLIIIILVVTGRGTLYYLSDERRVRKRGSHFRAEVELLVVNDVCSTEPHDSSVHRDNNCTLILALHTRHTVYSVVGKMYIDGRHTDHL